MRYYVSHMSIKRYAYTQAGYMACASAYMKFQSATTPVLMMSHFRISKISISFSRFLLPFPLSFLINYYIISVVANYSY